MASAKSISFNRDVRPILSSKCFFCHGPSEKSRKADLRLDLEEHAFRELDGLAAFVRNNLEDSEAWHRITSEDPDEVMPPPEFKKELTGKEIETLRQWILQGAKMEGHWPLPQYSKRLPKNDPRSLGTIPLMNSFSQIWRNAVSAPLPNPTAAPSSAVFTST